MTHRTTSCGADGKIQKEPRMKAKITKRSILIVLVIVLSFVVEISLRLAFGLGSPALVSQDPSYGYAFVPDQSTVRFGHLIKYNHEGLRSEELDSRPKVLCLGDSVTNGGAPTDQSNTYPSLTESALKSDGKDVQVLNASAGGWAPANEYAFLQRWGTYGARVVVLEIGTNDFYQDKADAALGVDPAFPIKKPMFAIEELITRYLWPRVAQVFSKPVKEAAPIISKERLDVNMKTIEAMIQYAKGHGAIVYVLWVPNREDVESTPGVTVTAGRQALETLCRKNGITFIDTREAFASHWNPIPFRDDFHPNKYGNRIIAGLLDKSLATSF
jgi:lysophospholipase L1-like esterase